MDVDRGTKRQAEEDAGAHKRSRLECVMACPHGDWTACTHPDCVQMMGRLVAGVVDAVSASPPCQMHTQLKSYHGNSEEHRRKECIVPVVQAAEALAGILPMSVENVPEAKQHMVDHLNTIIVCGQALGLNVTRHRVFGFNTDVNATPCGCIRAANTCGHYHGPPSATHFNFQVAGNGGGKWGNVLHWFRAMGYDPKTVTLPTRQKTRDDFDAFTAWREPVGGLFNAAAMTRHGLCESIPPVYASHVVAPRLGSPKLVLDLFAGEGGASRGFMASGATVIAVDTDAKALSRNPAPYKVYADAVPLLQGIVKSQRAARCIASEPASVRAAPPWLPRDVAPYPKRVIQRCEVEPPC